MLQGIWSMEQEYETVWQDLMSKRHYMTVEAAEIAYTVFFMLQGYDFEE
jgi:hypothetical protein